MSADGAHMGVGAERALGTILGGEPQPEAEEQRTPEFWRGYLLAKDDNIDGYDAHAEVMAKYMMLAIMDQPGLRFLPNTEVMKEPIDWSSSDTWVVLVPSLDKVLKEHIYPDADHPFRKALREATGFSYGWAYNMARYALGLPPLPNPAIMTIST